MIGFQPLPLGTLKLLFSMLDINVTVRRIEARYANSGRGRHRYPVRSMLLALLFMRFEFIPSIRKLCRRLERRLYARDICEFHGKRTPDHTAFSKKKRFAQQVCVAWSGVSRAHLLQKTISLLEECGLPYNYLRELKSRGLPLKKFHRRSPEDLPEPYSLIE